MNCFGKSNLVGCEFVNVCVENGKIGREDKKSVNTSLEQMPPLKRAITQYIEHACDYCQLKSISQIQVTRYVKICVIDIRAVQISTQQLIQLKRKYCLQTTSSIQMLTRKRTRLLVYRIPFFTHSALFCLK